MNTMKNAKCPHCGNKDQKQIEDNGVPAGGCDYTLLCTARVKTADRSWTHVKPLPDQIDAKGLVACGFQWSPNE